MKTLRKFLTFGLVLCLALGVCFTVVACSGDEHEHTFATEWSKDENKHWHAADCGHDVRKDEGAHDFDESGKCSVCGYEKGTHTHTFSEEWSKDENMHWHAATCEGHESVKKDEEAHKFDESGKCSVCGYQKETAEPETVTYNVTVKCEDEAIEGLVVTLTGEDGIPHMATTNGEGIAAFELEAGTYQVSIESTQTTYPFGYILEQESYEVTETAPTVEIKFIPDPSMMRFSIQLVYASGEPVVGLTVALHRQNFDEDGYKHVEDIATASAKTDDTGTAVIRAPQGVYEIRLPDCPANYGYQEGLIVETTAPNLPDKDLNLPAIILNELGTGLKNRIPIKEGTYTVTVTAERKSFFYEFHPSKEGYYRITSAGTYTEDGETKQVDTWLKQYAGGAAFMNETPIGEMDNVSGDNVHFDYRFLIFDEDPNPSDGDKQSYLENNIFAFEIGAYATLFGTDTRTFTFTITYDGDYTPPTKKTVEPEAQEVSDVPYTAPAETVFTWLHYTQYDQIVYNATDKFYHFGSESGPVVLAAIGTSKILQGLDASLSFAMAQAGIDKAVTWSTGIPDENNVVTSYDCRKFINAYIAAADKADGYHPLTEELKKFLAHYTVMHGAASMAWDIDNGDPGAYLFACGYYKSNYETPVSGAGSEDDAYIMGSFGTYRVELKANTPVWFATRVSGVITFEATGVTLSYNGGTYTDSADIVGDPTATRFSFTATADVEKFLFTFSPARGSEENPIELQENENTIAFTQALLDEGVWYSFTAKTTMLYKIKSLDAGAVITSPAGYFETIENGEEAIFEAEGGVKYLFTIGYTGSEQKNFTVTIEKTAPLNATGAGSAENPKSIVEMGWYMATTKNQNGEWGEWFEFNAKAEGKWRLSVFNRQANIIFMRPGEGEEQGTSYSLSDDETKAVINIETTTTTTGVFKFFMGANMGGDYGENREIVYYFYFEEVVDTPVPTPPAGGNTLVVGENTITISDANAEMGVDYTFTAPEDGTYTFTITGEGHLIYLSGDIIYDKLASDSPLELSLTANQTITITCASDSVSDDGWNVVGCTYKITVEKKGGEATPVPSGTLSVGTNTIKSYDGDYTFIAKEAGDYVFSCTDANAWICRILADGNSETILVPKDNMTSKKITLGAGETVTLSVANEDFSSDSQTFTLTITKA